LRVLLLARGIRLEPLEVDAQGRALGARARKAQYSARAIAERDADALAAGGRAVDRVDIREVGRGSDLGGAAALSGKRCETRAQITHQRFGRGGIHGCIVVARVVVAPVAAPM